MNSRSYGFAATLMFAMLRRGKFCERAINVVHPFNALEGAEAYLSSFVRPLQQAFEGLYRRDDIFMSGQFDGKDWISSTGYYVGRFSETGSA